MSDGFKKTFFSDSKKLLVLRTIDFKRMTKTTIMQVFAKISRSFLLEKKLGSDNSSRLWWPECMPKIRKILITVSDQLKEGEKSPVTQALSLDFYPQRVISLLFKKQLSQVFLPHIKKQQVFDPLPFQDSKKSLIPSPKTEIS